MTKPKEYTCTRPGCGHHGVPLVKMGGLICEKCRIILFQVFESEYVERITGRNNK